MGAIGDQPYDELRGPLIIVRFIWEKERIGGVSATGKHRGFRSVFEGNVECTLEAPIFRKEHKL